MPTFDFFRLERLHEAFCPRVVIWVTWPAHADRYARCLESFDILEARILDTAIGMMHQTWRGLTLLQGRFERPYGQAAVELSTQVPADNSPGINIQDYRKVYELLLQTNVGNVCNP